MASRGWTRRGALAALTAGVAAACGRRPEAPRYMGVLSFRHGVASGDPQSDRVVIWTRVTPEREGTVPVRWIVARNRHLTNVVQTGVFETDARRDYTVKVDVAGLRPGAAYFYGFSAGDQESPTGQTKALPTGRLEKLSVAVASCASFSHGFFNAYEAIAREKDLDLVIHLGDYIYEYGLEGFGGDRAVALGRLPQPEVECLSLNDYRQRHAQYKAEPELQAAHARCPWICAWDDHEIANNDWSGGAQNHNQGEGDWTARKRAALQAYFEWMPIRDPAQGGAWESLRRSFQFGDLATLLMLETRLSARSRPLDYATDLQPYSTPWDFTNPEAPRAISPAASYPPNVRILPVPYEEVNGQLQPVFDWPRVKAAIESPSNPPGGLKWAPDRRRLDAARNALDRRMIGTEQEQWLARELAGSVERDRVWQLVGNQVLMAPLWAPDLHNAPQAAVQAAEAAQPGARQLMQFTRWPLPFDLDSWDGYPKDRARVLDVFKRANGNVIVLTGDSHAAWANELNADNMRVAVELGATSITSPGIGDVLQAGGVNVGELIKARNSNVKWTDQLHRGYLKLTLDRRRALAEFMTVSTIASKDYTVARAVGYQVQPAPTSALGPLTPAIEKQKS
ncbi:MAG: alkaline phosphatase D family protein [Hyphomonadaceae bacterium]|nr:alkaline phosphatase D family protein [Hyphomonadaceae bacterium]